MTFGHLINSNTACSTLQYIYDKRVISTRIQVRPFPYSLPAFTMLTSFNESRVGLMYEDDDVSEKAYSPVERKRRSPLSYAALWAIVLLQTVVIVIFVYLYRHARAVCRTELYLFCKTVFSRIPNQHRLINAFSYQLPRKTLSNMR